MRGTRIHPTKRDVGSGIIPAYAGNTPWNRQRQASPWDHPRVCGEHSDAALIIAPRSGSSPRMRGTLHDWPIQVVVEGIIPAYAGNTRNRLASISSHWDHPRVCGEHGVGEEAAEFVEGSSPRMRGTLRVPPCCFRPFGIIPAYAGNTYVNPSWRSQTEDHPRVCGEHSTVGAGVVSGVGSSPRMRGTPIVYIFTVRAQGIIPAYAGNTR